MTKAADLIDALLARKPGRPVLDRRSGLPYAWGHWARTRDVVADVAYDSPQLIEAAALRPSRRLAGVLPALTPWQAFRRLWWQQWDPRPRDERPYHWLAVLGSLLIHLLFVLLLVWVAVVRWGRPPEPPGEEGRVRLEMIGRGGPEQTGGGPGEPGAPAAAGEPAPRPRPPAPPRQPPSSQAQAQPTAEPAPPAAAPPSSEATAATPPEPQPVQAPPMAVPPPRIVGPVVASQPLQVTETVVQTHDFVLPPPQRVEPALTAPREIAAPQVQVIERPVEVVQQPVLVAPRVREIDVPVPAARAATVREREVTTLETPQITVPEPGLREVAVPTPRTPEPQVRQIEVPSPVEAAPVAEARPAPVPADATAASTTAAAPAASPAQQPAPAQASAATPATAASAAAQPRPAQGQASASPSAAAGSSQQAAQRLAGNATASGATGPRAADRSGGWESAARGDDWSVGHQNRAGDAGTGRQGQGLFNADGSVRVPGAGEGVAERGAPGSESDSWSRERIASSGTWLKRPPYDYTPTSFDQYWVPNESLLEEWVRKGLKKIEIPIPGTNTRISCVVSLLQFGGGCGLSNPNVNDQPAQARPPPDIPFKKELQEANGSAG